MDIASTPWKSLFLNSKCWTIIPVLSWSNFLVFFLFFFLLRLASKNSESRTENFISNFIWPVGSSCVLSIFHHLWELVAIIFLVEDAKSDEFCEPFSFLELWPLKRTRAFIAEIPLPGGVRWIVYQAFNSCSCLNHLFLMLFVLRISPIVPLFPIFFFFRRTPRPSILNCCMSPSCTESCKEEVIINWYSDYIRRFLSGLISDNGRLSSIIRSRNSKCCMVRSRRRLQRSRDGSAGAKSWGPF